MKIPINLHSQFARPHGLVGNLVGRIMAVNNKERTGWAVEQLNIQNMERILEIGFGPGLAVKQISEKLTAGNITGIEHSELMLKHATKLNYDNIRKNKVRLLLCPVEDIKFPQENFDKIFGINVHFFWQDPVHEFRKLNNILKRNGKLFMIFQPRWARNEEDIKKIAKKTVMQFKEAGLQNVKTEFKAMKPVACISISGEKE